MIIFNILYNRETQVKTDTVEMTALLHWYLSSHNQRVCVRINVFYYTPPVDTSTESAGY
jgi:hypothetical protein